MSSVGVPAPTSDLARAEQDLRDTGVCLFEGALSPAQLGQVREALYRAADDDVARGRTQKFGFDYAHDDTSRDRRRAGIFGWYTIPIYRPQENWFLSLDPSVRRYASDTMRTLLGYKAEGLGLVNGASPE